MRSLMIVTICINLTLVMGCANKERIYGNIYEGLKTRETIAHPSVEQTPPEKAMSYQEYQDERKRLLEHDNK